MVTIISTSRTFGSYIVEYTDGFGSVKMQISDATIRNFASKTQSIKQALTDYITANS